MLHAAPRFRSLTPDTCLAVLARNHVGRLAYARHNHVEIEPLNYVYADGWLYGRTSPGAKLDATGDSWWPVAFEVDEIDSLFCWRSVVVHGGLYRIEDDGLALHHQEWVKGVERLRRLIPETFTEHDPVPFRSVVFTISVQTVTGREALPAPHTPCLEHAGAGAGAPELETGREALHG
jgi:nitroimidazol reductase NimA-like FMN-containing flavoprotein (pyridoxamine 5'-phosphate oxidase superfamily)